jgi:hypothetical protein
MNKIFLDTTLTGHNPALSDSKESLHKYVEHKLKENDVQNKPHKGSR